MQKNDVLTLENNQEYLILDLIEQDNKKYLYCVGLDQNDIPTQEYKYLQVLDENNELVAKVEDETLKGILTKIFTAKFLNSNDTED